MLRSATWLTSFQNNPLSLCRRISWHEANLGRHVSCYEVQALLWWPPTTGTHRHQIFIVQPIFFFYYSSPFSSLFYFIFFIIPVLRAQWEIGSAESQHGSNICQSKRGQKKKENSFQQPGQSTTITTTTTTAVTAVTAVK